MKEMKPKAAGPAMNERSFITRRTSGEEDVITFYDDYAASWDDRFPKFPSTAHFLERRWRSFVQVLGDGWGKSLAVELGVGTGIYIEKASRLFSQVLAVDGSANMLRELEERLGARGIANVRLIQSNVLSMPAVESEVAGVVYFFGLLEHIVDHRAFTAEIRRILRRGGVVVGVAPNGGSMWYALRRWVRGTGRHCSTDTYYTRSQILSVFTDAGFVDPVFNYWGAVPAGVASPLLFAGLRLAERTIEPTWLARLLGGLTFRFRKE